MESHHDLDAPVLVFDPLSAYTVGSRSASESESWNGREGPLTRARGG